MRRIFSLFIFAVFFCAAGSYAFAQETEEVVVDEVIAQVNDGVITLSRVRREMRSLVEAEVQQGKKKEDVERALEEKQGELISELINEELLLQLAKELGLERDIEAEVNNRFRQVMQQYGLTTVVDLEKVMREGGVEPQEIREVWRNQITQDQVIQRQVRLKVYWESTDTQLQAYFDKHKEKFTKPETISVSELFLSFAGRDEAAVREKARQLVAELRNGGDFEKIVVENSDRPDIAETKGKVPDPIPVPELDEVYAKALKDKKIGEYTDPIEPNDVGILILKVDARAAATGESHFDENAVRMAILREKEPEALKKFMAELRQDAYIKLSERYRPLVAPILFAEERKEQPEKKDN